MAVLVPTTTVATGGWKDQTAGTVNLHGPLADEDEDTFDVSPARPVAATLKVGLTNAPPDPGDVRIYIDAVQVLG